MKIECALFGPFRDAASEKTLVREVPEGTTVGDLLADLSEEYPDLDGRLLDDGDLGSAVVTTNGKNVAHLDGLDTQLHDGDVVRISPPIVGG